MQNKRLHIKQFDMLTDNVLLSHPYLLWVKFKTFEKLSVKGPSVNFCICTETGMLVWGRVVPGQPVFLNVQKRKRKLSGTQSQRKKEMIKRDESQELAVLQTRNSLRSNIC